MIEPQQMQQPAPVAMPTPQPTMAPPPVTIDDVVALLRNDQMRGFRIDVETDSLVERDQDSEKQLATEFVRSVGEYLTQLGPIVQVMPPLAPLAAGMLQFAVRRYRVGQELEDLIERTMNEVSRVLGQPKPMPQPSPDELVKLEGTKAKVGAEIQKAQISVVQARVEAQAKMMQQGNERAATVMEGNRAQAEHQMDMNAMQQEQQMQREQHAMDLEKMRMQAEADAAKQKSGVPE